MFHDPLKPECCRTPLKRPNSGIHDCGLFFGPKGPKHLCSNVVECRVSMRSRNCDYDTLLRLGKVSPITAPETPVFRV